MDQQLKGQTFSMYNNLKNQENMSFGWGYDLWNDITLKMLKFFKKYEYCSFCPLSLVFCRLCTAYHFKDKDIFFRITMYFIDKYLVFRKLWFPKESYPKIFRRQFFSYIENLEYFKFIFVSLIFLTVYRKKGRNSVCIPKHINIENVHFCCTYDL